MEPQNNSTEQTTFEGCKRLEKGSVPKILLAERQLWMSAKSLVPYRQCSAARTSRASRLLMRSSADTAICAKPLARKYGD